MTRRGQGDYYEHRAAVALELEGYVVLRSPGSLGPFDLAAMKAGEILLVQVKKGSARLGSDWLNDLFEAAQIAGAKAIVADFPIPRRPVRWRLVTDRHPKRPSVWRLKIFELDQVAALGGRREPT
jgi:Holliday junction resolvase